MAGSCVSGGGGGGGAGSTAGEVAAATAAATAAAERRGRLGCKKTNSDISDFGHKCEGRRRRGNGKQGTKR